MTLPAVAYPGLRQGRSVNFAPIKYTALSVGALALAGEVLGSRLIYPNHSTEIGGEVSGGIVFGGLGTPDSHEMAQILSDVHQAPLRHVRYGSRVLNAATLGDSLEQHYEAHAAAGPADEMPTTIYGHSLGTKIFLAAAAQYAERCRQRGLPLRPLENCYALSSPLRPGDTHLEKAVRVITGSKYPGGIVTKPLVEFASAMREANYRPAAFGHALKWAATSLRRGDTAYLWVQKLKLLASEDIYKPDVLDGVLTPDTTFYHLGDHADTVSKIQESRDSLRELVSPYGCRIVEVDTPGLGHANVLGSLAYLADIRAHQPVPATATTRLPLPRAA